MIRRRVWLAVAALVLASWIGNALYFRGSQLPEAKFLRHYIEATDGGASFFLYYLANRQDDRKIANVSIEGLPWVQFSPPSVHTQLRHQTIYTVTAIVRPPETRPVKEPEPLIFHSVRVSYSDGTITEEPIGEIRMYREAALPTDRQRPFDYRSTSGSSDGSGSSTIAVTSPVTLTDVSSAWLPMLGSAFQWEIKSDSKRLDLPADIPGDQAVTLAYKFRLPKDDSQWMDVYQTILKMSLRERDGREWTVRAYANYMPYPSERQMRAYVQQMRRETA